MAMLWFTWELTANGGIEYRGGGLSTTYTVSLLRWNVSCRLKFPPVTYCSEKVTLYSCWTLAVPPSLSPLSTNQRSISSNHSATGRQSVTLFWNQTPKIGLTSGRGKKKRRSRTAYGHCCVLQPHQTSPREKPLSGVKYIGARGLE